MALSFDHDTHAWLEIPDRRSFSIALVTRLGVEDEFLEFAVCGPHPKPLRLEDLDRSEHLPLLRRRSSCRHEQGGKHEG
jgi:hypothetical protein